jgi:hypothetical protein
MVKLALKQLAPGDALNNQVLGYEDGYGSWAPIENASIPTSRDRNLTPAVTVGDNQSTSISIYFTPADKSYVSVYVNGISANVGDGYLGGDCYFSDDAGVTAKEFIDIASGDVLYWNGIVAGFDLDGSDIIDLDYEIPTTIGSGLAGSAGMILVEKKTITSNTNSVTFTGLNGETDAVYYCTYRILESTGAGSQSYYLRPNGLTTNQYSVGNLASAGASVNTTYASDMFLTSVDASQDTSGDFIFFAKKADGAAGSVSRQYIAQSYSVLSGVVGRLLGSGIWEESSTTLTSLEIYCSGASAIGTGSEIALYKLSQS